MAIRAESGSATRRSEETREAVWSLKWEKIEYLSVHEGRAYGKVLNVSGTIYQNDKPASDFSGDRAASEKDSNLLTMEGRVKLVSRSPKATLTCDRLEWDAKRHLIVAKGNVRVESPLFTMDSGDEVWATPDLKQISTPDLFRKRHGS